MPAKEEEGKLGQPLLPEHHSQEDGVRLVVDLAEGDDMEDSKRSALGRFLAEMRVQFWLAAPLAINFTLTLLNGSISLAFVGREGTLPLAAAALANTGCSLVATMVILGLAGAIDSLGSQAYGAGNLQALPLIFQRSFLFLFLHCFPLCAALLAVPWVLQLMGNSPELCRAVFHYTLCLIPGVFAAPINRPMIRLLVAQGITRPQFYVALVVLPLHVLITWLLMYPLRLGYLGAGLAMSISWWNVAWLLALSVRAAGLQARVWGTRLMPEALRDWKQFAALAYPACIMTVIEASAFDGMTLLAGLVPDPDSAIAAVSVALNIYGLLYMLFLAASVAASTRTGQCLGAGDAAGARRAAMVAILAAPLQCIPLCILLLEPHCKAFLVRLFAAGADQGLETRLGALLGIAALMEFFDGLQTNTSGVIKGAGKQSRAALVNVVAYWVVAIPLAALFAFKLGWGVLGLYGGLAFGPFVQAVVYVAIVLRLPWEAEARKAAAAMAALTAAVGAPPGFVPLRGPPTDALDAPPAGVAGLEAGSRASSLAASVPLPLTGRERRNDAPLVYSPLPHSPVKTPRQSGIFPPTSPLVPPLPRIESDVLVNHGLDQRLSERLSSGHPPGDLEQAPGGRLQGRRGSEDEGRLDHMELH